MTLADRIAAVLLEQGPLPGCVIATTVEKRKTEVLAALYGDRDRFVRLGEARASRWHLVNGTHAVDGMQDGLEMRVPALGLEVPSTAPRRQGFTVDELAARWGTDTAMGQAFVRDFLAAGYLERVDGNGRVVITDQGVAASTAVEVLNPEALA